MCVDAYFHGGGETRMRFGFLFSPLIIAFWSIGFTIIIIATWKTTRSRLSADDTVGARTVNMRLLRHLVLVIVCALLALMPQIPRENPQRMTATEVYFIVDTTGSMGALDYSGKGVARYGHTDTQDHDGLEPRIDGVRKDILAFVRELDNVKFSVISSSRVARTEIPLTADSRAVENWVISRDVEYTAESRGTSLDRAFSEVDTMLRRSQEKRPNATRLLFVFSDGEETVDKNLASLPARWSQVRSMIAGGGVLQYGTTSGAIMPYHSLSKRASSTSTSSHTESKSNGQEYIIDPKTHRPAISHADPSRLRRLARDLGVRMFNQNDGASVERIVEHITKGKSNFLEEKPVKEYRDFTWPLVAVLAIVVIFEASEYLRYYRRLRRAHVFRSSR